MPSLNSTTKSCACLKNKRKSKGRQRVLGKTLKEKADVLTLLEITQVMSFQKKKISAQEKQGYFMRMERKKYQENKTNKSLCNT